MRTKVKQWIVLYARRHRVCPAERKFGIAQKKNIHWWLKNFSDSDLQQVSIANQGPKKQRIVRGKQYSPNIYFRSNRLSHVSLQLSIFFLIHVLGAIPIKAPFH